MRRTKIVATIGPAADSLEVLSELLAAGLDVARLNASHASVAELQARLQAVRLVSEKVGRHVGVLLDLSGPKLRLGEMHPGAQLEPGSQFDLVSGTCVGDATHACVTYGRLAGDVSPGDRILLDDGRIELHVLSSADGIVTTRVEVGGVLSSRKGVSVPGVRLHVEAITPRDREVLAWGLDAGVDCVAQSFVRSAEDVHELRALMGDRVVPIVAKIEKHEAAEAIGPIVDVADAVMVARGDLGVETSPEAVPVLQRDIIGECRNAGKPVIIATQMLESMIASPRPTRAEASDVANAIFDRVDAVMLSAETAIGQYPVETVRTMERIARTAEESVTGADGAAIVQSDTCDVAQAVSAAVCRLARDLQVAAIVVATESGATARSVARHRPATPIVAVTPSESTARRLSLVWGVTPLVGAAPPEDDRALDGLAVMVCDAGFVSPGDRIALTAGVVRGVPGSTDFILVREIPRQKR